VHDRLFEDGLLRLEGGRARTTRRWQAALARAAARLRKEGAPWIDLRLPIAVVLAEEYPRLADVELAELVEAMLPIEEAEVGPALAPRPTDEPATNP